MLTGLVGLSRFIGKYFSSNSNQVNSTSARPVEVNCDDLSGSNKSKVHSDTDTFNWDSNFSPTIEHSGVYKGHDNSDALGNSEIHRSSNDSSKSHSQLAQINRAAKPDTCDTTYLSLEELVTIFNDFQSSSENNCLLEEDKQSSEADSSNCESVFSSQNSGMSFPNRSTYEEAICDLKRKLQQQQQDHSNNTSSSTGASSVNSVVGGISNNNSNYPNSLRQSTSTISDIADSTTMSTSNKNPNTETITLAPNGGEHSSTLLLNNTNSSARQTKDEKNGITFPILTTFKSKDDSEDVDDTDDAQESESLDESSLVYRTVVSEARKSPGNSQSDADVLKLMLKERDALLKDYAIKLNEAEMESRSNVKKTRSLEQEKQKVEKQLKEFQKALDEEIKKRDVLENKLSEMQYTMKDLETKASVHESCDPEKDFLQSSLNEVAEENENLRTSLQSKCDLIQSLTNQFENREDRLAESNDQLKTRAEKLQKHLKESQTEAEMKSSELQETKTEIKDLKKEIYELMLKVHEKEKMIGAVNEEYSSVQEDNAILEEKLRKMENELLTKKEEMDDMKKQLKEQKERIKTQEEAISQTQEGEIEKKVRQKMKDRFEAEQKDLEDSFKKKMKREVESTKSSVTKELRHKHLKDLEKIRDDLESTHSTELELVRKELDEKYSNELQSQLKEKESDFKRTMDTYQSIIHKLESKVNECNKISVSHTETLQEVEEMLGSLIKYTSGTSQTIYLDVTALNTTEIKEAFQKLTTKIFELIDEVAFLNRQTEHSKEVRQELESKLQNYQKDFVPAYMYKQIYNEYVKTMKKRDASEKTQIVPVNTSSNLMSNADEASIFEALRTENLQLLEDKLSQEQQLNKLILELTSLKDHQTKTEDYDSIQEQLLHVTKKNQENVDLIASLKDENMFLIDQLESLTDSKAKLESDFLARQNAVSESLEQKSQELKDQVENLIEKNKSLSDQLADSVDSDTVVQLQQATKELLKQNNELNVENEVLLEEISSVNAEKEHLEEQLELVSQQSTSDVEISTVLTSGKASPSSGKRVHFNLSGSGSKKSRKGDRSVHHDPSSETREIVLYRPPARDIIEKQLAQENTHLFAVNTKLFSEREKLKEELFQKNMELNDERIEVEKERKELKQRLNNQRLSLQKLSSRVRIYSYQSTSPTELELKIKRELITLEQQIADLINSYQKECKKNHKYERYFLYEISDSGEDGSTSTESSSMGMGEDEARKILKRQIKDNNEEFSDLDEKLRLTQNSIAEKSKEIEAIRSHFENKDSDDAANQKNFPLEKYMETKDLKMRLFKQRDRLEGTSREIPPHRNVTTVQSLNVVTVTEEHYAPTNSEGTTMYLTTSPSSKGSRSSWRMDLINGRN